MGFIKSTVAVTSAVLLANLSISARGAVLEAQYDFQNASNLGLDNTGNGNTGSVSGGVTQLPGRLAGTFAAHFDGSGVITVPAPLTGYSGQPGFSIAAWVNFTDNGTYDGIVSQDPGGCCENRLLINSAGNPFLNVGGHNDTTISQTTVPQGTWFQIVETAQDNGNSTTTADVYINGVEITGSPLLFGNGLPNASTFNTYLGTGEGGGAWKLTGTLSDVRIYQGALSAGDVHALYAATVSEPATLILFGLGALGLFAVDRRRRKI